MAVQQAASTKTGMTADQVTLLTLSDLQESKDWRGVVAMEREAMTMAAEVRASIPGLAASLCGTLGIAYKSLGDFSKAIEHHTKWLAIAQEVGDRAGEGRAYGHLGAAYESLGNFAKAAKCHRQHLEIAKELGDRAEEGRAYGNLGSTYQALGDFGNVIEYKTQHLLITQEVGDRAGEGRAYGNLGSAYQALGDFAKAIENTKQHLSIAQEVGDRAGEGGAYGNLGSAYQALGDFAKAIEHKVQHLSITQEVGDRAGEGKAYGNLGNAYWSHGDFSEAIEHHTQGLTIAQEVGNRAGEGLTCNNLGICHMHLGEFVKAAACHKAQHATGIELGLAHMQSQAAMGMGVALRLHVRAARQGPAVAIPQGPGPRSHPSASACLNDKVREAAKWLQAALDGGREFAQLHLAYITFEAGQEDAALAHLKEHLSWRVQRGRDTCAGCGQKRGEDAPMLTCSGCRVARFCSADHQKMASKKAALGGNLLTGRHKDICGVLGKWRQVVKDGVSPDSCTVDLLAFLQR
jgi:tetratricopeptide (TPR) repeat protein